MRPGFRDLASGWMMVRDFATISRRIEDLAEWAVENGPLEADEQATIQAMVNFQVGCAADECILLEEASDCGTCALCPNTDACQRMQGCLLQ